MKDKISVVTVCYNSANDIERTIRSVIEQTYDNIEYIIIDGASTDGTVEVIKRYASNIALFISEPDKGIYDAMNKGIAKATGEWLHFRNSGDFFLRKDSVEEFFRDQISDEVMIVHGNCLYFDEHGWYKQTPPSLRVSYREQIPVLHPATFVRTKVQKQMPFDLQYKSSADYDFFYKCCEMGLKYEYRPMDIVAFAKGGFSSDWKRSFFEDSRIQGKYNAFLGGLGVNLSFWKKYILDYAHKCSAFVRGKTNPRINNRHHPFPLPTDF